ncbi:MAG: esterase [Candidatus Brockarchaeota archaeon]|nr:esterase [Candidatus Brockarchaeota archaeon]
MGSTLPHEHLFFDLRGPSLPVVVQYDREEVVNKVLLSLLALKKRGASTLVECSTGGIGRDPVILETLARKSGINVLAPAGLYKEAFMPSWVGSKSVDELAGWMRKDITEGIGGTSVKAGFIKLAASDDGLTPLEEKVLRAAARAAKDTGVAISDHTTNGRVLLQEVEVLKEERFELEKFVWVHAHAEPDFAKHVGAAEMGINVEYDAIGSEIADGFFIELVKRMASKGHERRILISQDAGGYNLGEPGGGNPRDLCYIFDKFLPKMEEEGMNDLISVLMVENPRRIFEL